MKVKKTTVVLCTHNLDEAQKLADHLILLNKGQVIAQGNLADLRSKINPFTSFKIVFLRNPDKGWDKRIPGTITGKEKNEIIVQVRKIQGIADILATVSLDPQTLRKRMMLKGESRDGWYR